MRQPWPDLSIDDILMSTCQYLTAKNRFPLCQFHDQQFLFFFADCIAALFDHGHNGVHVAVKVFDVLFRIEFVFLLVLIGVSWERRAILLVSLFAFLRDILADLDIVIFLILFLLFLLLLVFLLNFSVLFTRAWVLGSFWVMPAVFQAQFV